MLNALFIKRFCSKNLSSGKRLYNRKDQQVNRLLQTNLNFNNNAKEE